jgi:hypothetical protein
MAPGSWSLRFNQGVVADLADRVKYFGHIIVVNEWFDPDDYADADIKGLAAYTGIVRRITFSGTQEFMASGCGVAGWMGARGRGYIYRKEREYDGVTLTNALTQTGVDIESMGLLYAKKRDPAYSGSGSKWIDYAVALTEGTITDPSSGSDTYTGVHIYQTVKEALEECLAWWGETHGYNMEWKANHDGTLDIGEESDLYVTTPTCLLTRFPGGDPEHKTVWAAGFQTETDIDDYMSRVLVMGSGAGFNVEVAAANQTAYPSEVESTNFIGQATDQTGMVSQPFVNEDKVKELAREQRDEYAQVRRRVNLSLADYETIGTWEVGDTIAIYDPDAGFVDTDNEAYYQGRIINPIHLRIFTNTWPIREGMGVFYRDGGGSYTDLTRWIAFETQGRAEAAMVPVTGRAARGG